MSMNIWKDKHMEFLQEILYILGYQNSSRDLFDRRGTVNFFKRLFFSLFERTRTAAVTSSPSANSVELGKIGIDFQKFLTQIGKR